MRGTQVKVNENQEAVCNPSQRRKFSVTIAKKYMHYKAEYLKLETKGEDDQLNFSFVVGVVKEKYDSLKLSLNVVSVSNSHFNKK
jgi:hypothetical protein